MMRVDVSSKKTVTVETNADAVRAVMAHWARRGSRAFYSDRRAGIVSVDGVDVAHVSYNGRMWAGVERMRLGAAEIQVAS